MSNRNPTPGTVLRRAIGVALRQVRVALPGRIESYDATTCEADVQPLVMEQVVQPDGSRFMATLPVVPHVPVIFCGGGGSRLTFPVAAGDTCWLMFASSSIDRWLALGDVVDPEDDRHHNLSDGVALVGLTDFAHASAAHATATVLEGDDVRLGDDSGAALAFNANLKTVTDAIKAATAFSDFKAAITTAFATGPAGTQKVKAT